MTDYDRIGGEAGLRAIIADFVDRVFDDVMIGFIFTGKSPERLREMEFQLASEQLGGPHVYRGRDIAAVHAPLPIMGGHFLRRRGRDDAMARARRCSTRRGPGNRCRRGAL